MATKTLLTLADFQLLPWPDGGRQELDEGELITLAFPTPLHNDVAGELYVALHSYLKSNPVGHVYPADTGYILSEDPATLRGPDVSFITLDRFQSLDLHQNIQGAPDIAVEVVSPSETAVDLHKKTRQHLKAGCQTVWIVYPDSREIEIHDRTEGIHLLAENDTLTAPRLLPGFNLLISTLFPQP